MTEARWLFGDQLGPHFLGPHDGGPDDGQPVLLIESHAALARRPYHRAKAHLILSAMRHRARDLGDRATLISAPTYGEGLRQYDAAVSVCDPTSRSARALVRRLGATVLPARGFVTPETEFARWAESRGRRRLLLEDFYRHTRRRLGLLMDGDEPRGGAWNFDASNRLSPPRKQETLGLPEPAWPAEDDIDDAVRAELDARMRDGLRLVGADGPRRFAVTRSEALAVLDDFIAHRLPMFGPYEDATMDRDWVMAHSLLSVPMNLGLLHPLEVVGAAVAAYEQGSAPIESVEGFVRQVVGWRDYVWHLYWHLGPDYVTSSNALFATEPLPDWFRELDSEKVTARCLSSTLKDVHDRGWVHHIPRLMILGNWALQRGYDPAATTEWFHSSFVDGYEWVMAANVVGMALYADGGVMATKPYAGGGAYINRMTDYCGGCHYRPDVRVGDRACPFSAGYWWFIDRTRPMLAGNHRMAQPLRGLERLSDREAVVEQERMRGDSPP